MNGECIINNRSVETRRCDRCKRIIYTRGSVRNIPIEHLQVDSKVYVENPITVRIHSAWDESTKSHKHYCKRCIDELRDYNELPTNVKWIEDTTICFFTEDTISILSVSKYPEHEKKILFGEFLSIISPDSIIELYHVVRDINSANEINRYPDTFSIPKRFYNREVLFVKPAMLVHETMFKVYLKDQKGKIW